MAAVRKWWKWVLLLVVLLIAAQVAMSLLVQTHRMRNYLVARLERSFGRPVEAGEFSIHILPVPELAVDGVTIGEDPAFGHEYFLRAERMTASLRWTGLLLGHFEFGTISLTHPSLILARNPQGQWNLEYWLPPVAANGSAGGAKMMGPQASPGSASNRLQRVTFSDGRINFKLGAEKLPFGFINVSGNVEQTAPGRWQVKLEAQPWRTGIALQSTGTLYVRGDVAGTSARLQPAEFQVHWEKASVADIFRLLNGTDWGVRGEFALDGTASIGKERAGAESSTWKFQVQARAAQLHRWNLAERADNPRLNLKLAGKWDAASAEARVTEWVLEAPHSNVRGTAAVATKAEGEWNMQAEALQVEAGDLLAWYRAFHENVAETLAYKQFFSGGFALRGWPLQFEAVRVASDGGTLVVPGLSAPVQVGTVSGGVSGKQLVLQPVRITLPGAATRAATGATAAKSKSAPAKTIVAAFPESAAKGKEKGKLASAAANGADISVMQDLSKGAGNLRVAGRIANVADIFTVATAFGHTLNAGWELTGPVAGEMDCEWERILGAGEWSGVFSLSGAQLVAAGLNLPVEIGDAHLTLKNGARSAAIGKAEAFGASWSGTIREAALGGAEELPAWQFKLHADHLNASELDRWIGPRARPGWLERLLPSLLGKSADSSKASELIRRIRAEGELSADAITIERIKMTKAQAQLSLQNLEIELTKAEAQWAGGTVRGKAQGIFSQTPKYEIEARVEGANLAQMPWNATWAERWSGTVSGALKLTTAGIGRLALLEQLAGSGEIHAKKIEMKGWDVAASLDSGMVRTGASRWSTGGGEFTLKSRVMQFEAFKFEAPHVQQTLSGTFGFGQEVNFRFRDDRRGSASNEEGRVLLLAGPMAAPVASLQGGTLEKPVH